MTLIAQEQIDITFPDVNIKREKVLYVDPQNGDNLNAINARNSNNFRVPFRDYQTARNYCDWPFTTVVLLPGIYQGVLELVDGVDVYACPGVYIQGGFTVYNPNVTCRVWGHAQFTDSGNAGLSIETEANGSDITFEFDKMYGNRSIGIRHRGDSKLTVIGNSMFCGNPIRIFGGNKEVYIEMKHFIKSYSNEGSIFGKSISLDLIGNVTIKSPVIESTSTSAYRTCLYFAKELTTRPGNDYQIKIISDRIKQNTSPVIESYSNIISSCVWIDGGDNIHIYGDLEGNTCNCVSNRGGGSSPHYGTFYFYGNMSSDIEIISTGAKVANGNGWHSIVLNGKRLTTAGTRSDASACALIRTDSYNSVHGGNAGDIVINESSMYNKAIDSNMFILNQASPNLNSLHVNNSKIYTEGASGFAATSSRPSKEISYNNVISNKPNDAMIVDKLTIPQTFNVDSGIITGK
jgi:hypothetical protein